MNKLYLIILVFVASLTLTWSEAQAEVTIKKGTTVNITTLNKIDSIGNEKLFDAKLKKISVQQALNITPKKEKSTHTLLVKTAGGHIIHCTAFFDSLRKRWHVRTDYIIWGNKTYHIKGYLQDHDQLLGLEPVINSEVFNDKNLYLAEIPASKKAKLVTRNTIGLPL
jgi:hypothetical protein